MEKWSGKKPLVDMLRVFGCMGLVHVPKEKRDKLQATAVWAVHLELKEVSHDLGGAEGEAADVEEVMQQGEAPVAERGDTEEEVQQPTPSPKLPPRRTTQGKRDAVRGGAKEGAAKERPKRAAHPRNFLKYERLGVPKALLVQQEEDEEEKGAKGEMKQICCFGINLPHEPASMEEALAGDDREAWLASREDEFQSHMENETLERRKTRLVIKRFQQREGIDFQEVFAPVAKAPTLRLLLAAAAVCGWKVEQMDVKTVFLYGVVDEEIYMKQREGYDDGSGRVCSLNKAIYGLKQAPRCWYARLMEVLEALGFKVSGCDESLFMTEGEEEKVFLLVYVDDILLFSPSIERIKEVQGKLKETFQCKAIGPVGYYLGLHVERDEVKGCSEGDSSEGAGFEGTGRGGASSGGVGAVATCTRGACSGGAGVGGTGAGGTHYVGVGGCFLACMQGAGAVGVGDYGARALAAGVAAVAAACAFCSSFSHVRRFSPSAFVLQSPPETPFPVSSTPISEYYCTCRLVVSRVLTSLVKNPRASLPYVSALTATIANLPPPAALNTPLAWWLPTLPVRQDSKMASSTGIYVDAIRPPEANVVDVVWIFKVKRPPGSPPVFKAGYAARGFSQREGVDFFQTFTPTPKMTTLRVLLHVAAQQDYELHSLDFSTFFLHGHLHEEI
ncbi:unnamed protein product [Closterium sp. NIES-54]